MPEFAIYPSLKGRSVFVSGGGSGIGASIVEHLAAQGAKVAFVDINEPASKQVAAKTGALFLKCDIKDTRAYQAALAEVAAKQGAITVLVNNAAHDERHKLEDVTPEFWDDRIAVNLRHAFFAIQAVVPGMKKAGGGSIVNFSSISYHTMTANLAVYQAAKAATIGMTRMSGRVATTRRTRGLARSSVPTARARLAWATASTCATCASGPGPCSWPDSAAPRR